MVEKVFTVISVICGLETIPTGRAPYVLSGNVDTEIKERKKPHFIQSGEQHYDFGNDESKL
jgi:hypothetical protein